MSGRGAAAHVRPATAGAVARGRREFGDGVIARLCDGVYRLAALEVCLVLACVPGIVATTLLVPDPSNAALFALAGLPVGPAVAAGLHAVHRNLAGDDTGPFAAYVRGYRATFRDAVRVWLVVVAVAAFLAFDVTVALAGGAVRVLPLLGLLGAGTLVAGLLGVAVTTAYDFRTRDALRLAGWSLVGAPASALGVLALLAVCAAIVLTAPAWVLPLLAAVLVLVLAVVVQPLLGAVGERFTR